MTRARDIANLVDANGDIVAAALSNVPPSNDASALTTGTLDIARLSANSITAAKLDASAKIAAGTIAYFTVNSAPSGWLKANGSTISRAYYPDLFAAIGTTYGAGDGSTTFKIPDCRGEFLRSWDDSRGIDSGRSIGSYQKGSITAFNMPNTEGLGGTFSVGNSDTLSAHQPTAGVDVVHDSYAGTVTHHHSATVTNTSTWWTANGWGAGVTRPRNLAFLACIKY